MGYSCTKAASDTLAYIQQRFQPSDLKTRVFRFGSADYFFERGREREDGAITGTLVVFTTDSGKPTFASDDSDSAYGRNVGTVRIEADGTISRFPRLDAASKKEINSRATAHVLPSLPCMIL